MKLLLDTNIFIWLNDAPQRIPDRIMSIVTDPDHNLSLSLVSVWEMQIKIQLGKLQLQDSLQQILTTQQSENDLQILTIELGHILRLADLPHHHRDPFDRLIIAQTQAEEMTLVSADGVFASYDVNLLSFSPI
ncbi:MAG: type II toxin-antitoxin system VapC family toxin [Chamaesiphon sp.]|nr:type II toxin-antitoxin system VapC family toxin [Chamaesiphon sp.]